MKRRYTIAVDFDGVLHRYETPWVNAHTIPDGPVPGAIEWLGEIEAKLDIVIHSTRCKTWRGRRAVRRWLNENGYTGPAILSHKKLPALVYLDDRALRFTGANWPTAEEVHRMRPWNKR